MKFKFIDTVQESVNHGIKYGVYSAEINGRKEILSLNSGEVKVLTNYSDRVELEVVTQKVANFLLESIN